MYKELEDNYRKQIKEFSYIKVYWITALFLFSLCLYFPQLLKVFQMSFYLIPITILFFLLLTFFLIDYKKVVKQSFFKKGKLANKLSKYKTKLFKNRINIIKDFQKEYNCTEKDKIQVIINHYESKKSISINSSFKMDFIVLCISLASFIACFYDEYSNGINFEKLIIVLNSSFVIIIIAFLIYSISKYVKNIFVFPKNDLYSYLLEDLTYILFNQS